MRTKTHPRTFGSEFVPAFPQRNQGTVAERDARQWIGLFKENSMPQSQHEPIPTETGEQVPARPHDSGSQANETMDGLDAAAEALRKAAEDTPTGAGDTDVEKVPVFDRADLAPKI
jgi:hypothetical protein